MCALLAVQQWARGKSQRQAPTIKSLRGRFAPSDSSAISLRASIKTVRDEYAVQGSADSMPAAHMGSSGLLPRFSVKEYLSAAFDPCCWAKDHEQTRESRRAASVYLEKVTLPDGTRELVILCDPSIIDTRVRVWGAGAWFYGASDGALGSRCAFWSRFSVCGYAYAAFVWSAKPIPFLHTQPSSVYYITR